MQSIQNTSNQNDVFFKTIEADLINDYEQELSQHMVVPDVKTKIRKS